MPSQRMQMDSADFSMSGRSKLNKGPTSSSSPSLGNRAPIKDFGGEYEPTFMDETSNMGDDASYDFPSPPTSPGNYQPRTQAYFHRPSSVSRVGNNASVVAFNDWAQSIPSGWDQIHQMFVKEGANPAGGTHMDDGNQGVRGITKRRWIRLLMGKGFTSEECAAEVFEEIAKEIRTDRKGKLGDLLDAPAETMITLPQLKRFERRMVSVNATLDARDHQSPAARFVKLLVKEKGSVLRAWRMDLDKRGTGRVAYTDFTNACRNLGVSSQGKLIWNNLRQDKVTPLEFHELDEKEASNLEDFAETLWSTVGFDLGKAWLFLDTNNQNYLSYEEFKGGVRKLGFEGDAKLLFKGLDSSGLGRVKREEFDYISKVSRIAQSRLGGGQGPKSPLTDLITWVQRELGGAHELIVKLGLANGEKEIVVGDLAARLTALGFEGDALQAATRAARSEGGTHISAEQLFSLLSGGRPRTAERKVAPPKVCMSARSSMQPKGAWCDSVDNISAKNLNKCKHQRNYFGGQSSIDRDERSSVMTSNRSMPSLRSGASPYPAYATYSAQDMEEYRSVEPRPAWNDNYDAIAQVSNKIVSSHSRKYFSDVSDKPVREEHRALIRQRKAEVEGHHFG